MWGRKGEGIAGKGEGELKSSRGIVGGANPPGGLSISVLLWHSGYPASFSPSPLLYLAGIILLGKREAA